PPADGGFKYNPPHGGPAESEVTAWIEERANALLQTGNTEVKRLPWSSARKAPTVHAGDLVTSYVDDLAAVVDLDAIRGARVRLGVDPLGGASRAYWRAIADVHGLDITITNPAVDPTFRFMTLDHDGKV